MKTPMQELIDRLNNVKPQDFCSIETIKGWAESMLDKESDLLDQQYEKGWHHAVTVYGAQEMQKLASRKEKR